MATLLTRKKSTYGSPYCFYTLKAEETARTSTTVTIKFTLTAALQYSSSSLETGYELTAGVYIGGAWETWRIKASSTEWFGTTSHTTTHSVKVNAAAGKDELTGLKFRVQMTESYNGSLSSSLTAVSIPSIDISTVVGNEKVRIYSDNTIKASAFTVSSNCRINSSNKILWPAFNSGYSYVRFYPDEIRAKSFIID